MMAPIWFLSSDPFKLFWYINVREDFEFEAAAALVVSTGEAEDRLMKPAVTATRVARTVIMTQ